MELIHHPQLTASELATLWNTYMADTMGKCMLIHFKETVEDKNIEEIIDIALQIAEDHIITITELFHKEQIPIPHGFDENDINRNAPRLFSDVYYLRYLEHMGRTGLTTYALAKAISTRKDIREHFKLWYEQTEQMYDLATDLALAIGTYVRSPYIDYYKEVQYVENNDFLGSIFGKQRSLLAIEIAHLGTNIEVCHVGQTLLMGFSQVAKSKEIRHFLQRGTQIGKKQITIFFEILKDSNTSYPSTWDALITGSIEPPFSDKLMLFQANLLSAIAIADFGAAISGSVRRDIGILYARLMAELGSYAEDGAKYLIKQRWLEKPPQTHDREYLINRE
ncbi:DUF3231 family protein [Neobacillus sp. PS3-40]|uniref:DUF3231 family protein n=1 Tax=Neobacillus sp. PS3-40 TaxID=3070679 RepID=UPI0027E0F519|nr:DUF3231 family protein [Neobacillus sp. PS3-40]WML42863.1 DUF3231 family protein [Neobacillus sp. PS3-40]